MKGKPPGRHRPVKWGAVDHIVLPPSLPSLYAEALIISRIWRWGI